MKQSYWPDLPVIIWRLNVLQWPLVSIKRHSKNRRNKAFFILFPGEPLHGYRICIQAILQDKPKIATQNLPEVSVILFFGSHLTINCFRSHLRIVRIYKVWIMNFASSFSIWSSCGQSRIALRSVWPSCGLLVKLGFTISARDYEVKPFNHGYVIQCHHFMIIKFWSVPACCWK